MMNTFLRCKRVVFVMQKCLFAKTKELLSQRQIEIIIFLTNYLYKSETLLKRTRQIKITLSALFLYNP